jgi:hypothetical protein
VYHAFGVTRPGAAPTNPSPTVTVRGLPGRLALDKPWLVERSWAFVANAPSDAIDNRQLRAPRRAVEMGPLLRARRGITRRFLTRRRPCDLHRLASIGKINLRVIGRRLLTLRSWALLERGAHSRLIARLSLSGGDAIAPRRTV